MKKVLLKLEGKEMLTTEQMKMVNGGRDPYACNGADNYVYIVTANDCCEAQAQCDLVAFSNTYSNYFPSGGDVECADDCDY